MNLIGQFLLVDSVGRNLILVFCTIAIFLVLFKSKLSPTEIHILMTSVISNSMNKRVLIKSTYFIPISKPTDKVILLSSYKVIISEALKDSCQCSENIALVCRDHSVKNFQKHLTMTLKFTRIEGACFSSHNCLPR